MKYFYGYVVIIFTLLSSYSVKALFLQNDTNRDIVVRSFSAEKNFEQVIHPTNSQPMARLNQLMIRTPDGSCSYFSDIGMNMIYDRISVRQLVGTAGVGLYYTGKSKQLSSTNLTPIVFVPDAVDLKCFNQGSGIVKNRRTRVSRHREVLRNKNVQREKESFMSIANESPDPLMVELDLGLESSIIDLQPRGSSGSVYILKPYQTIYNIKIFSRTNGSCTSLNNLAMHPLFNRLSIAPDEGAGKFGQYRLAFTRVDNAGRSLEWNKTVIQPVWFETSGNSSMGEEYKATCWNPNTGDIFELPL